MGLSFVFRIIIYYFLFIYFLRPFVLQLVTGFFLHVSSNPFQCSIRKSFQCCSFYFHFGTQEMDYSEKIRIITTHIRTFFEKADFKGKLTLGNCKVYFVISSFISPSYDTNTISPRYSKFIHNIFIYLLVLALTCL